MVDADFACPFNPGFKAQHLRLERIEQMRWIATVVGQQFALPLL
jgi:hypothetical protein